MGKEEGVKKRERSKEMGFGEETEEKRVGRLGMRIDGKNRGEVGIITPGAELVTHTLGSSRIFTFI